MRKIIKLSNEQQPVIPGAIYIPSKLPEYTGNPLIEALPPFRLAEEMLDEFGRFPIFLEKERYVLSNAERMLAIMRLDDYFEPLPYHFDVIDKIGLILRAGYRNRNPRNPEYGKALVEFYRRVMEKGEICPLLPSGAPTAPSASLFGVSGTGTRRLPSKGLLHFCPPRFLIPNTVSPKSFTSK